MNTPLPALSHKGRGILLISALLLIVGCASNRLRVGKSAEGEVVEAEGLAPYNAKDLIATKRASLTDAQRTAVEKAVGTYITARTRVDKAVAIENNILARSEGYVKKYEILKESIEGDLYKTRIRALVAMSTLESDLKNFSIIEPYGSKKIKLTVAVEESVDSNPTDSVAAQNAFQKSFIDRGYIILGAEKAAEADLVVSGRANASPFQATGLGGFVSYRAVMSVEVKKPSTGEIMVSLTKEASGLGGSPALAASKALETVGTQAGDAAASDISRIKIN
jgi:hypothetical protein